MSNQLIFGGQPVQLGVGNSRAPGGMILSIGEGGKVNYNYNYVRLNINSNFGAVAIQFSMLQFFSDDGAIYQYPADKNISYSNINTYGSETFDKALISTPPTMVDDIPYALGSAKLCAQTYAGWGNNTYLQFDLGDKSINFKYFCNWRFFASNDTWSGDRGRNPRTFTLQVSTDGLNWIGADVSHATEPIEAICEQNYGLTYVGKINIKPENSNL